MKDLVVPAQPRVAKQDLNNEVEWLSRMILTETNKVCHNAPQSLMYYLHADSISWVHLWSIYGRD